MAETASAIPSFQFVPVSQLELEAGRHSTGSSIVSPGQSIYRILLCVLLSVTVSAVCYLYSSGAPVAIKVSLSWLGFFAGAWIASMPGTFFPYAQSNFFAVHTGILNDRDYLRIFVFMLRFSSRRPKSSFGKRLQLYAMRRYCFFPLHLDASADDILPAVQRIDSGNQPASLLLWIYTKKYAGKASPLASGWNVAAKLIRRPKSYQYEIEDLQRLLHALASMAYRTVSSYSIDEDNISRQLVLDAYYVESIARSMNVKIRSVAKQWQFQPEWVSCGVISLLTIVGACLAYFYDFDKSPSTAFAAIAVVVTAIYGAWQVAAGRRSKSNVEDSK